LKFLFGLGLFSQVVADDFSNLRVVCFGCSSGMGKSTAEILLRGGARVVIAARSPQKAKALLDEFPSTSIGLVADSGKPDSVTALAAQAKKFLGKPVTSLVYTPTALNFGAFRVNGAKAINEQINEQLNLNVYGLGYVIEAFRDDLIATSASTLNLGSILAVSSIASEATWLGLLAYGTAKAAQDAYVRSLAMEFAGVGVRVNSILPATIKTGILEGAMTEEQTEAWYASVAWRHALGRVGESDECGHVMAFLVSDKASFITGQLIKVDGGMSVLQPGADALSEMMGFKGDSWYPISRQWTLAKQAAAKKEL